MIMELFCLRRDVALLFRIISGLRVLFSDYSSGKKNYRIISFILFGINNTMLHILCFLFALHAMPAQAEGQYILRSMLTSTFTSSNASLEIVILIDESSSVTSVDFGVEKGCVENLLTYLKRDNVLVSLYRFAETAEPVFERQKLIDDNRSELLKKASDMVYSGSPKTYTHLALQKASGALSDCSYPSSCVVLLITDGQPTDLRAAKTMADQLINSGVEIIGIGFGVGVDENKLQMLSSKNKWFRSPQISTLKAQFMVDTNAQQKGSFCMY